MFLSNQNYPKATIWLMWAAMVFHGGRVAANLIDFGIPVNGDILIINLAKNLENVHHLNQRTQGFFKLFYG